ncbi:hypothetical protein DVH24_016352 [Malus domestica]|uniref:Serpin domain-containing protein n=1 Tax=Malus domestica TaxID=3750 RepID=A0A498HS09_MALDO|nr:hypothetical protein DVH24_016352 [Malus domestica]
MDPKEYSTSNLTDVALKITKHLLMTEGKGKNIVYSPLSIQLSFLKSESSDQLNSLAAHLVTLVLADGSARGGPCLNFANALWVEESLSIKPSFREILVLIANWMRVMMDCSQISTMFTFYLLSTFENIVSHVY